MAWATSRISTSSEKCRRSTPRQHPIPEDLLSGKGDASGLHLSVDLEPAISKLRVLVAPGPSGMRNEYLMCLVGGRCPHGSAAAINSLNTFCTF